MTEKATIVIDFDTIYEYDNYGYNYKKEDKLKGNPYRMVKSSLEELSKFYNIIVYTPRCLTEEDKELVEEWLDKFEIPYDDVSLTVPPHLTFVSKKVTKFEDRWSNFLVDDLKELNPSIKGG